MDYYTYYKIHLKLEKERKKRRERIYSVLGIVYGGSICLFVLAVVLVTARCMGVI